MSVNAINAEPQQKQGSAASTAVATGIGTGVVGAGAGYFLNHKRPDLDKVFAMKPDEFTRQTKDASGEDATKAVNTIKAGIEEVEAIKVEDAVRNPIVAEAEKIDLGKDAKEVKAIATAEENLAKKVAEEANKGLAEGAEKFTAETIAKPENKAAYDEALAKLGDSVKAEKQAIEDAKAGKLEAQIKKFIADNKEKDEFKEAIKKYNEAVDKVAKDRTAKITELAGKEDNKKAFEVIKKLFPKETNWKAVGIWGAAALAVGAIAGYFLGGNKQA